MSGDPDPDTSLHHCELRRRWDEGDSAPRGGPFGAYPLHDFARDLGGAVRLVPPWRRVALHDREPFRFGDDPPEGMRAPEALPLVGLFEEDRSDLAPRALQQLLPLLSLRG